MADMRRAMEQALSEGLAGIQRQLTQVEISFSTVNQMLQKASGDRLSELLPALLQLQAAGAALAASIETVLRFAGSSAHWGESAPAFSGFGAPAAAPPAAAPRPPSFTPAPSITPTPPPPPVAAPPPPAPVVEAPPPPPEPRRPRRLSEEEVERLPAEYRDLHKKAKRFAKVTVQELVMYKRDEVTKGRDSKDIYERLQDEIDKSKALYDQRFGKIAEHNIDYLYDEMVRVLAEDDPSKLGKYPYPVPSRN